MMDQSVYSLSTQSISADQVFIDDEDRDVLRRLAEEMAELASRAVEEQKKELWYRHNALEETRPVIFCDPENGWNEIITDEQMQCRGDLARRWEMTLRKEVFWGQSMGDDKVIEAVFNVGHVHNESDWGMHEEVTKVQEQGSFRWDPPLKNYDDLEKLHFPRISVDYEATDKVLELADKTFGGILTVRLKSTWWWSLGMTMTAIMLRGLEQFMMDMYDYPDQLHQLMGILRDGHLAKLDFLEKNGLLSLNDGNTYVGSGGFGFTHELPQDDFDGTHVRCIDTWGFAESQETVSVSPQMFEEFVFPYQKPILGRFGLNCYGCCEPLHSRWHVVKQFPRLRRISVSPWADSEKMAEYLGNRYIYSMKPSPSNIAQPRIDKDGIRKQLRRALEITKGCVVEIIMKDNHTIGKRPENVIEWCRVAKEEAQR